MGGAAARTQLVWGATTVAPGEPGINDFSRNDIVPCRRLVDGDDHLQDRSMEGPAATMTTSSTTESAHPSGDERFAVIVKRIKRVHHAQDQLWS